MSRPSSAGSTGSTDSYQSALSDDSYLARLKPEDVDRLTEMLNNVRMVENHRKLLKERKIQSHELKKRDPNDTARRTDWENDKQVADWTAYKAKVDALAAAKAVQVISEENAKNAKRSDVTTQERLRNKALEDDYKWLNAAKAAAEARLGFMTKYPNAFSTLSTRNHLTAVEDNINSIKAALKEIETQKKKIADIKKIEALKAASAAKKGIVKK